jgi:hypothetical protein
MIGWVGLLRKCIAAGCDIHGIREHSDPIPMRLTPFLEVIHGSLHLDVMHIGTSPDIIEKSLRVYLLVLKASGVDLLGYGQKEKQLHDQHSIDKAFNYNFWPNDTRPGFKSSSSATATWHLIGFTYGPSLDDWRVWGSQPTDVFAGSFWRMIESPWERMPGAWIE